MRLIRSFGRRLLGLALWCAAATALTAQAQTAGVDPPARVGRLSEVQGTVWIYDQPSGEWVSAARNRPLTTGDRLATDRAARAEVRIGPTAMRLDGGTELQVLQLDDQRVRAQLDSGSLALRVHSREAARDTEIVTAEGRLQPQREGYYRIDRSDDTTAATVWAGALHFEADDSALDIATGQRVEFWRDGPTHYSTGEPERDAFAGWAESRDRSDERSAATRYVSPEMTGYEDLDRYGRWEAAPEYGPLWVPVAVAPDWVPYRYGHWAWISPWGWTWVDDAPWGFAPFHYGRWVWFNSHWCWAPGTYVARPVYAPALVAWVGGPGISVSITAGSAPPVGWFPLGPREVFVPAYRHSPRYVQNINVTQVTNVTVINQAVQRPPAEFMNRRVSNAVTVVPAEVLRQRRPVAPAVVRGNEVQQVVQQSPVRHEAPVVAPVMRAPNRALNAVAVPPPPGREERGRRGEGPRTAVPGREGNVQAQPPVPVTPQRPGVPAAPQVAAPRPAMPPAVVQPQPGLQVPQRDERGQREDRPRNGAVPREPQREQREVPAHAVVPVPPQPPQAQQPQRDEHERSEDRSRGVMPPQRAQRAQREVSPRVVAPVPQPQPQVQQPPHPMPQPQPQVQQQARPMPQAQPMPERRQPNPPRPPEGRGREAERAPQAPPAAERGQEPKERGEGRRPHQENG